MIKIIVGEWKLPSQWNLQAWPPTFLPSVPKKGKLCGDPKKNECEQTHI
jgi:hypothetical protein